MTVDRSLPTGTLREMVARVRPAWQVSDATPAGPGHLPVYHVSLETPDGPRECVLKAAPRDQDAEHGAHGVATEAHLLAIVAAHTDVPVPRVLGLVETSDTLPAPFFLMDTAPGTQIPRRDVDTLTDDALARLARDSGRALAALHDLPALDQFGRVTVTTGTALDGSPPPGDPGVLAATALLDAPARPDWPAVLDDWTGHALDGLADSRFADLEPRVRDALDDRCAGLTGPFTPAVGRIDHGLHNLFCDPDTGEVTAMLDWAFTLAVPPAYDVACVLANLTLDPWMVHPDTPDRRALVRDAFRDGYAAAGDDAVLDRYDASRDCYDLLALTRAMAHLDVTMADADEADRDAVARRYRARVP